MKEFDKEQVDLVWESEEPWYYGLRGHSISGSICEKLLLNFLRKNIKGLKFSSGMITKSYKKGKDLSEFGGISPQIDIIVFRNGPLYESQDSVIVHEKDVVCTIEIKKWTSKPDNEQISKLKEKVKKPLIYVAFRLHKKLSYDIFKKECNADYTFIFSKDSNGNPVEALESKEDFFEYIYSGELKQLVETLKKFI